MSSDASSEGLGIDVTRTWTLGLSSEIAEEQIPLQEALMGHTLSRSALRRRRRRRSALAQAPTGEAASGSWGPNRAEETEGAHELARNLVGQFRAGGQTKRNAIAQLLQLTFADRLSSRAAQLALSVLPSAGAKELASGLHGHIREASSAVYAHHVVQKIVEVMPASGSSLVALELLGVGGEMARDRFGSQVLCSLLQNGVPNEQFVKRLIDEVMTEAETLCQHRCGSFVMGHILKFGVPGHRHMVVRALCADTLANAASKHGSRLVEAALTFASALDKHVIASDVLEYGGTLLNLSSDRFGCRVVLCLLKMLEFQHNVVAILLPVAASLRGGTKYSRRVLEMVEGLSQ